MNLDILREAARKVLAELPDPPVRVRLLREVLERPADDAELVSATAALDDSPHVRVLLDEQRADGSWGRFHSADSSAKQKIGTTEMGVERALELGLAHDHRVFARVRPYLEGILDGTVPFPDRAEKHENWPTGVAMFAGATLSRFAPESPALDETWEFWTAVAQRSFRNGVHDLDAELGTHQELLGRSGNPGWMRLCGKHVLMILGARAGRLPDDVESAYVRWLWEHCPGGLVYLGVRLDNSPQGLRGFGLGGWLASLELLSALPSSRTTARPAIERLLASLNAEGLWDFGVQASCPRFSANYRKRRACTHDWTMRVACLLQRFMPSSATKWGARG